jgi:hypothetical protein
MESRRTHIKTYGTATLCPTLSVLLLNLVGNFVRLLDVCNIVWRTAITEVVRASDAGNKLFWDEGRI